MKSASDGSDAARADGWHERFLVAATNGERRPTRKNGVPRHLGSSGFSKHRNDPFPERRASVVAVDEVGIEA